MLYKGSGIYKGTGLYKGASIYNGDGVYKNAPKLNVLNFNLFGDAPNYELQDSGSFNNVNFDGQLLSKLTRGTIILYFKQDKTQIDVRYFSIEFERVCFSPSGSTFANQIALSSPWFQLIRGFHTYNTQVGNKNQIVATYGNDYSVYNDAELINVTGMSESPFVIENDPFYDTLYKVKVVGEKSKILFYINDVKKAERQRSFSKIQYIEIRNETNNFPIGARNFKIEYY